jgi:hypothetical protein
LIDETFFGVSTGHALNDDQGNPPWIAGLPVTPTRQKAATPLLTPPSDKLPLRQLYDHQPRDCESVMGNEPAAFIEHERDASSIDIHSDHYIKDDSESLCSVIDLDDYQHARDKMETLNRNGYKVLLCSTTEMDAILLNAARQS